MEHNQQFLRSFGRLKSRKLRDSGQGAIENILPKVRIEKFESFGFKKIWLEIGFGGGEHLLHQARNNPQIGFIGCEPFINGTVKLLTQIEKENIKNIRVYNDDFRIFAESVPDKSIERAFILFPDPWPKKKHNKRRIIQRNLLDILARIMVVGGNLRIATDHEDYAKWIIKHFLDDQRFIWQAQSKIDWLTQPADHTETKYQKKNLAKSKQSVFFNFVVV